VDSEVSELHPYLTFLQILVALTEKLDVAVASDNVEQILVCLDERQKVMDQIVALPEPSGELSDEERALAIRLLTDVADQDQAAMLLIEVALSKVRGDLETSREVMSSLSAYRKTSLRGTTTARFVDTQK
jgi:hypothetical protein